MNGDSWMNELLAPLAVGPDPGEVSEEFSQLIHQNKNFISQGGLFPGSV